MSTLTALGEASYNGYTFPVETETLALSITPIYDSAGRTVAKSRYVLKIRSYILADTDATHTTDATLDTARRQLTAPAGQLKYTGHGLGTNIKINVAGGKKDLAWGPKPTLLELKPVGGNRAVEIVWQVEWETLDCSGSIDQFDILEYAYRVDYQLGRDRLTVRTVTGHIVIPQTRKSANDKTLSDTVDGLYEGCVPEIPAGFRREDERRNISEDRCRLDFVFRDAMMDMPLPVGCLEAEVEHSRQNSRPGVMTVLSGILTGRYKTAFHWPRAVAQDHFHEYVKDQINEIRRAQPKALFVPVSFSIREQAMSRSANFTFTYTTIRAAADFLMEGFWRPIPGHDHALWAKSMQLANRPRGYTQEFFNVNEDVIIDLCRPEDDPPEVADRGIKVPGEGGITTSIDLDCPTPETSWIWIEIGVVIEIDDGVHVHKPLPKKKLTLKPGGSLVDMIKDTKGFQAPPEPTAPKNKIQKTRARTYVVRLVGWAARVDFPISAPRLVSVGGIDAIPANREGMGEGFATGVYGQFLCPIHVARWNLRFVLGAAPTKPLGTPPNPVAAAGLVGSAASGFGGLFSGIGGFIYKPGDSGGKGVFRKK